MRGENRLEIDYPFGQRTAVEWCYVLGDFGVNVSGRYKKIVPMPEVLAFESVTTQGLPFYGGTVTYHTDVETHGERVEVTVPQYRAGVATVALDGGKPRYVTFAPYRTVFDDVPAGHHRVDIKLYLTRVNGFGPVHCADDKLSYPGPSAYRTGGDSWCYEYRQRPQGLTASPWVKLLK